MALLLSKVTAFTCDTAYKDTNIHENGQWSKTVLRVEMLQKGA